MSTFQSTRPRGARHVRGLVRQRDHHVSIHAPAWGATNRPPLNTYTLRVSIHAPAWGATQFVSVCISACVVSIHAPAWGATTFRCLLYQLLVVSIHAPAWGATLDCGSDWSRDWHVSIHAPAWGATCCKCQRCHQRATRFNPRARVGRDMTRREFVAGALAFQSTRPRGARHLTNSTSPLMMSSFNPRARVGRD